MSFPSLWLAIALFAVLAIVAGYLNVRAVRKDPLLGQRRFSEGMFVSLAGYVVTPAWFYALTGSFPTTYALGGLGLYALTGVALWFAMRAADLPKERRVVQTTCLNIAFMKLRHVFSGCAMGVVSLIIAATFTVIAFRTASVSDLSNPDHLFNVALWVFTIPTGTFFVLGNVTRLFSLFSRETPQQTRVQNFAMALRHYVMTAWACGYPYIAFHSDLIEQNPRWVALALIVYIIAYLVFVVLPYGAGRTRFIQRSREVLQKLDDSANRIIVATDRDVSEAYRRHIIDRVLVDLEGLVKYVVKERPFFAYYLSKVSGHAAALAKGELGGQAALALPAPGPDQAARLPVNNWDKIIEDYGPDMPEWDYRMYIITQIQELLDQPSDPGWLRGSAMAARISVARWLDRHYARSVVLGSIGVAASGIFAFGLQAYLDDLRGVAEVMAATLMRQ